MRKGKGKRLVGHLLIGMLIVGLMLSGCSSSNASKEETKPEASASPSASSNASPEASPKATDAEASGGTLRIIINGDATVLGYNPDIRSINDLMISATALETLGRYTEKGDMVPFLAESWQVDAANKTITIKLKTGIKFSDGTDFDAKAVQWNLEQFRLSKKPNLNETDTKSIEVVDNATVKINLITWDIGMLETITTVKMASPAAFEKNGKDWAVANPVGTGPFVLDSWQKDVSVKFKKNENYWQKGLPRLDGLEWKIIADPQTAEAAMIAKEADVYFNASAKVAKDLESTFSVVKFSGVGAFGPAIYPASDNPKSPWANEKVRQALSYALDRKALVDSLAFGYGQPVNQYASPGMAIFNADVPQNYDPDKAKQLLSEAGFADGFKTKLTFSNSPDSEQMFTAVQGFLKEVGIDVELVPVDGAKFREISGADGSWDGLLGYVFRVVPDISWDMIRNFGTKGIAARSVVNLPEIDEALAHTRTLTDAQAYNAEVQQLQKLIFADKALGAPLYLGLNTTVKTANVQNDGMTQTALTFWTPETAEMTK